MKGLDPCKKVYFCPQRCSQMLIYYYINCALLPSWEQKYPFFAYGLKLCKALGIIETLSYSMRATRLAQKIVLLKL